MLSGFILSITFPFSQNKQNFNDRHIFSSTENRGYHSLNAFDTQRKSSSGLIP